MSWHFTTFHYISFNFIYVDTISPQDLPPKLLLKPSSTNLRMLYAHIYAHVGCIVLFTTDMSINMFYFDTCVDLKKFNASSKFEFAASGH